MNKNVKWLPAVIAPVLVIAAAIAVPAAADAAATPPHKTAQQVLALVAGAKDAAYSGTVAQHSDLGLPQLPSTGPGSSAGGADATSQVLDLLTADHAARVFVDGASKQRLQVLDSLAERDVIRNGSEVWTYDSKTKAATHTTLPPKAVAGSQKPITGPVPNDPDAQKHDAQKRDSQNRDSQNPSVQALSPAQLADRFIQAITPSTDVTVTSTASVAGRSVYQLELTPKSSTTLVSHVVLSVDSATGLPLKVVVDARGQNADAFSLGFSSIDFSTPAASLFDFTPPKGAKVTTTTPKVPTPGSAVPKSSGHPKPTVTGTGWDTVVELPAAASTRAPTSGATTQTKLLDELTTAVPGGRAVQTSLLSVLLLDDGRILVGAVPIASLEAAAQ
ncbi:sigma-E factor regulatory protein RseB domain-containing protein [soil metagenome]